MQRLALAVFFALLVVAAFSLPAITQIPACKCEKLL